MLFNYVSSEIGTSPVFPTVPCVSHKWICWFFTFSNAETTSILPLTSHPSSHLPPHAAVEDSYQGPRLDGDITAEFMQDLLQWFKDEKRLHKKYAYKVSSESLFSLLPSSLLPHFSLSFILLPSPSLPVLSMCLFLPSSLQIILSVKKIFEALPTLVDVSIPEVSVTFSSSLFSYLTLFSSPSAPTLAPLPRHLHPPSLPPSLSATGLQCVEIFTDNFTIFSTSSNSMAIPQKTTPTYPSNHDKHNERR